MSVEENKKCQYHLRKRAGDSIADLRFRIIFFLDFNPTSIFVIDKSYDPPAYAGGN
ncbi:MAG: hypothetical protein JWM21_4410 [Acidobacteria bacterium]|nr:hypothetical protein [Acidobacteriota bacterium]